MAPIQIAQSTATPVGRQEVECVERKGLGHPDTITDRVTEAISVALCRAYLDVAGRILHHNIDKALLVAGQTVPALGGGIIGEPMRLVLGDRATEQYKGHDIAVGELVDSTARTWIGDHLRFVNPQEHLVIQNELRPGSAELVDIFARERLVANDTSAAVGYAPLTETEHLVLAAEHRLNSAEFKQRFPETGEDVKVMAVRRGRQLQMTVAVAFVDHFFWEAETYFHRKAAVARQLQEYLETKLQELDGIDIQVNVLDDPQRGLGGMYLTVLGTSAESGDGGQVGRGNRANGLISLQRPASGEAVAGKNAVRHVGKVYNLLAQQIADRLDAEVDAIEEAYVWLCSQIGRPLDDPWLTSVQVALTNGVEVEDVRGTIEQIVAQELAQVEAFCARLAQGELAVC